MKSSYLSRRTWPAWSVTHASRQESAVCSRTVEECIRKLHESSATMRRCTFPMLGSLASRAHPYSPSQVTCGAALKAGAVHSRAAMASQKTARSLAPGRHRLSLALRVSENWRSSNAHLATMFVCKQLGGRYPRGKIPSDVTFSMSEDAAARLGAGRAMISQSVAVASIASSDRRAASISTLPAKTRCTAQADEPQKLSGNSFLSCRTVVSASRSSSSGVLHPGRRTRIIIAFRSGRLVSRSERDGPFVHSQHTNTRSRRKRSHQASFTVKPLLVSV